MNPMITPTSPIVAVAIVVMEPRLKVLSASSLFFSISVVLVLDEGVVDEGVVIFFFSFSSEAPPLVLPPLVLSPLVPDEPPDEAGHLVPAENTGLLTDPLAHVNVAVASELVHLKITVLPLASETPAAVESPAVPESPAVSEPPVVVAVESPESPAVPEPPVVVAPAVESPGRKRPVPPAVLAPADVEVLAVLAPAESLEEVEVLAVSEPDDMPDAVPPVLAALAREMLDMSQVPAPVPAPVVPVPVSPLASLQQLASSGEVVAALVVSYTLDPVHEASAKGPPPSVISPQVATNAPAPDEAGHSLPVEKVVVMRPAPTVLA